MRHNGVETLPYVLVLTWPNQAKSKGFCQIFFFWALCNTFVFRSDVKMFFPADIQGVISKMNPELLKSVIGSVELKSNAGKCSENGDALALNPSALKHHETAFGYEKNRNFRHRCSDTDLNTKMCV